MIRDIFILAWLVARQCGRLIWVMFAPRRWQRWSVARLRRR